MEYRLIYHSYASSQITGDVINGILSQAKTYNAEHKVSGCLLFHNNEYLQLLEGEQQEIDSLFEHISKDPRHHDITVITKEPITKRQFDRSRMALDVVSEEEIKMAGAPAFSGLGYVKNDHAIADKLFEYFSSAARKPADHMHNAPVGPLL